MSRSNRQYKISLIDRSFRAGYIVKIVSFICAKNIVVIVVVPWPANGILQIDYQQIYN